MHITENIYNVKQIGIKKIDSKIICLFYNSVVSSVLVYRLSSWFVACAEQQKKKVSKFKRQACKITGEEVHASVEIPSNVYKQKRISLITKNCEQQRSLSSQSNHCAAPWAS